MRHGMFETVGTKNGLSFYEKYIDNYISTTGTGDIYEQINNVFGSLNKFNIEKVIFNNPATIVIWKDESKTIVKCGENDIYDPEKGLAMAIAKRALGDKGNYFETFKKWIPEDKI